MKGMDKGRKGKVIISKDPCFENLKEIVHGLIFCNINCNMMVLLHIFCMKSLVGEGRQGVVRLKIKLQ